MQRAFQKHTRAFANFLTSSVKTVSATGDDSGGPVTSAPVNPLQLLSDAEEQEKNRVWAKLLQKRKDFVRVWSWDEENKYKQDEMRPTPTPGPKYSIFSCAASLCIIFELRLKAQYLQITISKSLSQWSLHYCRVIIHYYADSGGQRSST